MNGTSSLQIRTNEVEIQGILRTRSEGTTVIHHEIASTAPAPMTISFGGELPPGVSIEGFSTPKGPEKPAWRQVGPNRVEFHTVIESYETVRTMLVLDGPRDAVTQFATQMELIESPALDNTKEASTGNDVQVPDGTAANGRGLRHSAWSPDEDLEWGVRTREARTPPSMPTQPVGHLTNRESEEPRPAVGVVATMDNAEMVARTLLRARERGYATFVTHSGDEDIEAVKFAHQLGAHEISPITATPDDEHLRRILTVAANVNGHEGLILQPADGGRIDFDRSEAALAETDNDWIEAVTAAESLRPEVVVGIPAYNEADTLSEVIANAAPYADEVLVVDDGSTDDTAARAREAGATVIEHDWNRGYGAALKTLFATAAERHAEHLVVLDGDGQHDPADIPDLISAQQETDAEVVIASRFAETDSSEIPLYRRLGLQVVNGLTNLSIGALSTTARISDTQSGFRAYSARALESLAEDTSLGDNMGASTDILHHAYQRGYAVEEIPTEIDYDVANANSRHPIGHGLTLVSNLLQTVEQRYPLTTLGMPGIATALLGLVFSYVTVANFLQSTSFPLGFAILSALLILGGLLASFTGIILHSLETHLQGRKPR